MRTNTFDNTCCVCGAKVPARTGALYGGPPWTVKCMPCSGEVANAPITIKVTRIPSGLICFEPSAYLGDKFNAYTGALKGCTFDRPTKTNRAKVDRAPTCITELEKAGFTLQVHPEVSASLQAFVAQHKNEVAAVGSRISKIDAVLMERGLALYPFQKIGVEWLVSRRGALLADDMGLGKTIQTLTALPDNVPVIVVGPLAAIGVWADELPKWRPEMTFSKVDRNDFHWPAPGEAILCTYGSVPGIDEFARFGAIGQGTVLVADEAHKLKGSKTIRTQRFRDVSTRVRDNAGRVWLLTGSPILNSPPECWAILQAAGLGNEAFGSYATFCRVFGAQQDRWGKTIWGKPSAEVPEMLRKVMLRREKTTVLKDLPPKTYRHMTVDIAEKFEDELEKCIDQLTLHIPSIYDWLRAGPNVYELDAPKPGTSRPDPVVTSKEILAARESLLKESGGNFEKLSQMRELLSKAKIPAMLNIVEEYEEQNEPLIVFSAHRAPIDTLAQREGWAVITGDVSGEDRQRIAREFQDGKYKGLALTIEAGGTALTLTRASNILFVDRHFTPKLNEQAEDRAVRIGQTNAVIVTILVANHYLDRRLAQIVAEKTRIIKGSIDAATINGDDRPVLSGVTIPVTVTEVDFDRINAETQAKLQAQEALKAEAERIAAERAKNAADLRAKLMAEAEEKKAKEKAKRNYERALGRARAKGWVVQADHPERREAVSESEKWAARGLAVLSGLDPDRAMVRNDAGFSRSDGYIGHWLSQEIRLGLTPNQWQIAIRLCLPYHRQIGPCPEKVEEEETPPVPAAETEATHEECPF